MLSGSRLPAVEETQITIDLDVPATFGRTTITGLRFSLSPSSGGQSSHQTINPCLGTMICGGFGL